MARGLKLTDSVRGLIIDIHRKHPKWKPQEIQREVNYLLRKDNPQLPKTWPGVDSVRNTIKGYGKLDDPRDKPWRLLDIAEYPIPPETLPIVLKVWGLQLTVGDPITIREAIWVARLYYVFKGAKLSPPEPLVPKKVSPKAVNMFKAYLETEEGKEYKFMYRLLTFAQAYAIDEIVWQLKPEHAAEPEGMWKSWWRDSWLYGILIDDPDLHRKCEQEFRMHFPEGLPVEDINKAVQSTYRYISSRPDTKGGKK